MTKEQFVFYSKKFFIVSIIFIIAFAFSLNASCNIWNIENTFTDSSVFRYVSRVILNGGMPYIDVFDHKGPLLYIFNVMGTSIGLWRGVWIIELITIFTTYVLIYKIARLKCGKAVSLLVMIFSATALFKYFEGGNLVEEYAMPFIAAATYIFIDYFLNDKISKLRLMVCGFAFGAVCLLRVNMGAVWIVMCIGAMIQCILKKEYKKMMSLIVYFFAGFLIIVVPIVAWLSVNGAFGAFIEDYFIFNFAYSSIVPAENPVARPQVFIYFLNNTFILFAISISVFLSIKNKKFFDFLYTFYLIVSLIFIGMSRRTYPHYGIVLIPALAYPYVCMAELIQKEIKIQEGISILIVIMMLVNFVLPTWLSSISKSIGMYYERDELHFSELENEVSTVVLNNTLSDDKIIVCGQWNIIYNLSNRFAASRYAYQLGIGPERLDSFFMDLETNQPKVIVLPKKYFAYDRMIDFINKYEYAEIWQNQEQDTVIFKRNW